MKTRRWGRVFIGFTGILYLTPVLAYSPSTRIVAFIWLKFAFGFLL